MIKFIPGQLIFPFGKKRVLGVVLVFNLLREHESLQKERILENFRKFSGPVEDVEGSFLEFLDRQNKICSIYLELENIHLEPFREILQEEIKECVTELIPKTFMRRNEEEIYKSIQVLRNQLNSVQDIPQAIINFEEQTLKDLFFTVVLLRIVKRPGSASVHELLNKATDEFIYIEDRNILVGTLEEKYEKEAAIFRIQIQKAPYFRKNGSLNLYRARMKVLSILTAAFGEIRDYNGGLMQEQNKQFEAFVESVQRDFDEFLHENFFYSINPIEMQSTLPTVLVREWFELFSQLFCLKTSQNENFWVASSAKQNIHMFAVRLEENAIKERILNEMVALSMPERNFASTEIYRKGEYYFGCLIRKNGLPDFQQRLPDVKRHQKVTHRRH